MSNDLRAQALFLHQRLLASSASEAQRTRLATAIERYSSLALGGEDTAHVVAFQDLAADLIAHAPELDVLAVSEELRPGTLVTLTQDFYIRRASEEEGTFQAKLDVDRKTTLTGRFSAEHLVGSTGQSETFGHKRFTMLAVVEDAETDGTADTIRLRPLFIGWRLRGEAPEEEMDDRREVWPGQVDQFSAADGRRATAAERKAVAEMSEREVKDAFAEIIGEPFVPKDWGGETSDLYTNRLSIGGKPASAAFAFKGPGLRGTLHMSGMGVRGDQGLKLAQEPADLFVVQHHDQIGADVRSLLSALARAHMRRYVVIDGESTAAILGAYGKLGT